MCQMKGTCAGSLTQTIHSHAPACCGSHTRGTSRSGRLSFGHPHNCPSSLLLCFAWQRLQVSLQTPNYFASKLLQRAEGCWKLWLLAPSKEARLGLMPLACTSLPGRNRHFRLPDGSHPSHPGSVLQVERLQNCGFPASVCMVTVAQISPKHTETLLPHPNLDFIPAVPGEWPQSFEGNVRAPAPVTY